MVLHALRDRRAFAPLYERHVDAIYRHCHRRLGEKEAAEDVTGLVFRKALEGLHSFPGGSFLAWLYTIADNAMRDAARAFRPVSPLEDSGDRIDPAPGPEELAMAAFDRQRLRWALGELPDDWQRVVVMRNDGFSCAEIARMLSPSRTVEWVRQVHHRAMLRMRESLAVRPAERSGPR